MENAGYIFVAFGIVWVVVFAYLLILANRQKRLGQEIESLRRTLKESGAK